MLTFANRLQILRGRVYCKSFASMKIAFVGKGGSGKSTVSWLYSSFLAQQGLSVLAIDADYNLDLLHNFHHTEPDVPHFLNTAEKDFYAYLQLQESDYYVDIPNKTNLPTFQLTPRDWFTDKYSFAVSGAENLRLMVTGMVPQEMLYGHRCGHAYISSLKYYLPLLQLQENEHVVVDAVAGTDLVSYGMFLGCDAVVVVVEETPHSVGVFQQISHITTEFNIPTYIVLNKYRDGGRIDTFIAEQKSQIIGQVPYDESMLDYQYGSLSSEVITAVHTLHDNLRKNDFDPLQQWQRHQTWREKYDAQLSVNKSKSFQFIAS